MSPFLYPDWRKQMFDNLNILCTGGAGTFGHALARRRKQDGWTGRLTVYSTDSHKHEKMRREYPDIQFIQGDIRSETLFAAMVGHDIVIHAAAVKIIPVSEYNSIDTFSVNVDGSINVCECAIRAGIKHVIGISTDKAAHPANAYGASKYMLEKVFAEFARGQFNTTFSLARFGNVLESNGSVIEVWRRAFENGEPIRITNAGMTRFWLSPSQAVQYVIDAYGIPNGGILIPKMPALSLGKLAQYTIPGLEEQQMQTIPVRPGEKVHETLLTEEEGWYAWEGDRCYVLAPTTSIRRADPLPAYSSDIARELTQEELKKLLEDG